LENICVTGEAANGKISVTVNGRHRITELTIDPGLMDDKEQLEDLLITAINRAQEEVSRIAEEKMKETARGLFPGFPGLF